MNKMIYRSDGRRSPRSYRPSVRSWLENNPGAAALIAVVLVCLVLFAAPVHAHPWDHIGECEHVGRWWIPFDKGAKVYNPSAKGGIEFVHDVKKGDPISVSDFKSFGNEPEHHRFERPPEYLEMFISVYSLCDR